MHTRGVRKRADADELASLTARNQSLRTELAQSARALEAAQSAEHTSEVRGCG